MAKTRSKKVFINAVFGILYEFVAIVCGLILPRLILRYYGSAYNGITSSITQFISCISLMKAGIGGATRAALYKPLAEKNAKTISAVVNQTQKYLRKIAIFFVFFVLVFAAMYPIIINRDFDWFFSFSLILIISISTFGQYYFGLAYEMVLQADMRQHVSSIVNIAMTIANTVIAAILINLNASIHMVKLGSSLVHFIGPVFVFLYVKKRYRIDNTVVSKDDLIHERWNALGHEIANFVNTNTDVMVLTIFSSLVSVSVYTVYNYAILNVRKLLLTFVTGFSSAFGNMYAKKEYDLMRENLGIFELIMFSMVSVVYPVMFVLIVSFARLYTSGVTDADYIQPLFASIAVIAGAFNCVRLPYQSIVTAAGDYKGTRNGAFVEAGLNILISIVFVIKFGLVGVAIGTLCATVFRTFQYAFYIANHIIYRGVKNFFKHLAVAAFVFGSVVLLYHYTSVKISSWLEWILAGIVFAMISFVLVLVTNFVFFKMDMVKLLHKTVLKGKQRLCKK